MERYLAALPQGVDSYPECAQKGAILSQALARLPGLRIEAPLPAPVRELLTSPPLPSAWVPEVRTTAALLAICESHFPSEAAYLEHALQANRALLGSALYRVLMVVATPQLLLRRAALRWEALHRGSRLEMERVENDRARASLTYPPGLFAELLVRSFATAFQAAVEGAGGQAVRCEVVAFGPTRTEYEVRWS
jgi:uncharacterized protein (TIGR02265 family)